MSLTPVDPKRYEYQNLHHLFLMYVWALTKRERIGALVVDAHGHDGHTFDAPRSRRFGGMTTIIEALELVTISKLPFYLCSCLFIHDIFSMVMFYLFYVLHVVKTCLDVVFIKTCIIHVQIVSYI